MLLDDDVVADREAKPGAFSAMTRNLLPVQNSRPTNDELHPVIYHSIIGLTIWLVLSVWVLFSRGEYEGVTLSVITLFFVVLLGIAVLLWLTWRRHVDPHERHSDAPLVP